MMMLMKIRAAVLLWWMMTLIIHTTSIDIENVTVLCANDTDCRNETITEANDNETIDDAIDYIEWQNKNDKSTSTAVNPFLFKTHKPTNPSPNNSKSPKQQNSFPKQLRRNSMVKNNAEICTCDLMVSKCDINCCCDPDCTNFHLTVFSKCSDIQSTKYDSRYCFTKNFIQRNNTQFILERITDNLFCIAYDNLPPIYSKSNAIVINEQSELDEILTKQLEKKFTWNRKEVPVPPTFDSNSSYLHGDVVWKIQNDSKIPFELPTKRITRFCSSKHQIQFLKDLNIFCIQSELNNNNSDLFSQSYTNFTVASSPMYFNGTSKLFSTNNCTKNICIPIESKYCLDKNSWPFCNISTELNGSCVNGSCTNIVERIYYNIIHNGTMGIDKIHVKILLKNTSKPFHQHFQVKFNWLNSKSNLIRSGNPGYRYGKPIVIGKLLKNNTKNHNHMNLINVNESNYYLTIPVGLESNKCGDKSRLTIGFGENIQTNCHFTFETNNLTVDTCSEIQKKIISIFNYQSLMNTTDAKNNNVYVSKLSNISNNNDKNNISNWSKIFVNKIPAKVVGKMINNHLHCINLTTIFKMDVVYSLLPKPDSLEHYKIIGIAISINESKDIILPKCTANNCTNYLQINLLTFVQFHDISTPKTYYYAGGPNLDISLPYDFFYPFLSNNSSNIKYHLVILITNIIIYLLI